MAAPDRESYIQAFTEKSFLEWASIAFVPKGKRIEVYPHFRNEYYEPIIRIMGTYVTLQLKNMSGSDLEILIQSSILGQIKALIRQRGFVVVQMANAKKRLGGQGPFCPVDTG